MPGKCSIEPYIHLKRIFYLIFFKKNKDVFNILFVVISNSQKSSNRKDKNILLILLHSILPNVKTIYTGTIVSGSRLGVRSPSLCVAFIG